jgi:hypothetical protein
MSHRKFIVACASILVIASTLFVVQTRTLSKILNGELSGVVTDPKGAKVVGASVTISNAGEDRALQTVLTDEQGRYRFSDLPPGIYVVVVAAKGFSEARTENVEIKDGANKLDFRLEIAPLEAGSVTVTAKGSAPNSDPVYQQLRQQAKDQADLTVFAVNNLVLQRDAARFTLTSGEIYFLPPVENRTVGAIFLGEGNLSLTPPIEIEKKSLAIFTDAPSINEPFEHLVLRFTDKTFDEIKNSPNAKQIANGLSAARALGLYRNNQTLLRKQLRDNFELRTLADVLSPNRAGFFTAFIHGQKHKKLIFQLDPNGIPEVSPEEVMLLSYGDTDGGIWTAFHLADEYKTGKAVSWQDARQFDITHHEIDCNIAKTARLDATDRVTLKALQPNIRVLPFNLYRTLRVSGVQDEKGNNLSFVQEDKNEDADLGVILPQPLEVGQTITLTFQYGGSDALRDTGGGNFILIPRLSWYPNNHGTQFGDRATFDVTYHFPKNYKLVGTGELAAPETTEDKTTTAKWTSGVTELAVAGFNYGLFKKKELLDKESGYNVEFYANEEAPNQLRGASDIASMSTTSIANNALVDAENSARIYNAFFGKLPYARFAMTQQPAGNFGQAWPTLVYMPFTAFMDSTQRYMATGGNIRAATDNFFQYVAPHEIAHQWWGHTVGWTSYHDQWMSEGFAEFSASLFVQYTLRDPKKYTEFWEDQRRMIVEAKPQTKDRKPYTVGPVTQGYRLNTAKTGSVARYMIYPKGAYILQMLRMMMHTAKGGDHAFQAMMHDFIKTYYNKDISTEDFKRIVERHITPAMDVDKNGKMDWFFDEWVYGTEVPSYRFDYKISGNTLSGRITQSGVSKDFVMLVPLYLDFGKGWTKFGSATLVGDNSVELGSIQLPAAPKRAAICAFNDVLAVKIENNGK